MSDVKFLSGIRVFKPNEKAPSYVKAAGVINKKELIEWLQDQPDEIRFQIKESSKGSYYAQVDNWKPQQQTGGDDLPF